MLEFSLIKVGERLKQIRTERGFGGDRDGRAFCRKYGENPTVWGWWEKGKKSSLYIQSLDKLCQKFDVSPTWLMYGKGEKSLKETIAARPLSKQDDAAVKLLYNVANPKQKGTPKISEGHEPRGADKSSTGSNRADKQGTAKDRPK